MKAVSKLMMIMMTLLLITACAGTSNEKEASPSNTSTNGKALDLSFADFNPPTHPLQTEVFQPFAEELAEKTDKRIGITMYPSASLSTPPDTYDSVVTGIADIGHSSLGYTPGKFPIHSMLNLPFMGGSAVDTSLVAQKLYEQFSEIQAEYSDVKPLWFAAMDPMVIVTTKKAVKSMDDIKGLQLRSPSKEGDKMIEAWGASPVSIPISELYDSLQKGVVDGAIIAGSGITQFNLQDIVKYVTVGNFSSTIVFTVMNKGSWSNLSSEEQELVEEMTGIKMAEKSGEVADRLAYDSLQAAKESGIEVIELSDGDLAPFKEVTKELIENWIAEMEKMGIPGQEIHDEAVKLMNEK